MSVAVWPASLPTLIPTDGYSDEVERNVISFQPEVGPPLERRRSSVSTNLVSYPVNVTLDEFETLKDFYRDDLKDGVLPFTRDDPITEVQTTYKFAAPPKVTRMS